MKLLHRLRWPGRIYHCSRRAANAGALLVSALLLSNCGAVASVGPTAIKGSDSNLTSTSSPATLDCTGSVIPEAEQVECAYVALNQTRAALNKEVLREIRAFPGMKGLVSSVETSWNRYSVAECRLDNSPYLRGSAYSLLIITCDRSMDDQRIGTIRKIIASLHR